MAMSAIGSATSGMQAASLRLEKVARNVANVSTTGPVADETGATTAYRPVDVRQSDTGNGVSSRLEPRNPAFTLQNDPANPDADADGNVAAPNVDLAGEMVDLMTARTAYKANAKVMEAASGMQRSLLDTFV